MKILNGPGLVTEGVTVVTNVTEEKPEARCSEPQEDALLHALVQNWEHARHQEIQRLHLLGFYAAIVTAVIYLTPHIWTYEGFRCIPFFLLFLVSLSAYGAFLKWNAAFGNHIAAIQWISEKLNLIKPVNGKDLIKRATEHGITAIPNYAFFNEAYMALPLPLSVRVHEWFFTRFPLILTALSFGLAVGVLAYDIFYIISMICSIFNISIQISSISLSVKVIVSIIAWVVGSLLMGVYCYRMLKRVKEEAGLYIEYRKPKGIRSWAPGETSIPKGRASRRW